MIWDDADCDNLRTLETLLSECRTLRNGGDFINRCEVIIELAMELSGYTPERKSFLERLRDEAVRVRENQRDTMAGRNRQ